VKMLNKLHDLGYHIKAREFILYRYLYSHKFYLDKQILFHFSLKIFHCDGHSSYSWINMTVLQSMYVYISYARKNFMK